MNDSDKRSLVAFLGTMQHSLDYAQRSVKKYEQQKKEATSTLDKEFAHRLRNIYSHECKVMERTIADFRELFAEELPKEGA